MNSEINVAPTSRNTLGRTCEILGCHRNTLRRYIKKGLLPVHRRKATGQAVIYGTDIIRFFNQCERPWVL